MRAIEYGVTPSTPSIHSRLARPRGPSSFFTLGRSVRAGELIKCEGGTLVAFFYPGCQFGKTWLLAIFARLAKLGICAICMVRYFRQFRGFRIPEVFFPAGPNSCRICETPAARLR